MRWQISWDRYVEKSLNDENMQKYFDQHRRDFDGTRLRVAQILLKLPDDGTDESGVRDRAESIRGEIVAGKLSFAEAARKYSQAPSAAAGGEIGWIARHEPMPEAFAQAAFQLQVNEISPPTVTPLGVHLIQCREVEPGQRTWQDAQRGTDRRDAGLPVRLECVASGVATAHPLHRRVAPFPCRHERTRAALTIGVKEHEEPAGK